jgi:hypothetical protein
MGLKDRLRRLEREAEEDGIVIRLQDGTVRVFDSTMVAAARFAARMSLLRGIPRASEVLDAVRRATPESRAAFEESCGSIVMGINIIAAEDEGGWVETRTLTEAGEIERVFYEGGSAEAEHIRRQARREIPPSS